MPAWYVIFNPGSGRAALRATLEKALREAGLEYEVAVAATPQDTRRLAREAVIRGVTRIAIAGGDGTAHQVINGLMSAVSEGYAAPVLGVLALGTGNDWARSLRVPQHLRRACCILAEEHTAAHDVGLAILGADQDQERHYFINAAGAGFDSHVLHVVQGRLRGRWRYYLGLLQGMRSFEAPLLDITSPELQYRGAVLVCFLSIGRYLGGGMRVAPAARCDDGLFELTVVQSIGAARILANLPRLLFGNLADSRWVRTARCATVEIDGNSEIEADGELLGRAPARFELIPRALRVVVGKGAA